ncbi:hypothetical protein [Micavibrio aeruginosavorus]|uniref:hypothetical protein n=1 Tax=Micavibrio aeruginosavorus TaxID=349221 RepID=UPI003F4A903B
MNRDALHSETSTQSLKGAWTRHATVDGARGTTLSRDAFKAQTRFLPVFATAADPLNAPRYVVMTARQWQGEHTDGTTRTHAVADVHVLDQPHIDRLLTRKHITQNQVYDRVGDATRAATAQNESTFESCSRDYTQGKHAGIKAWRLVQHGDAATPSTTQQPATKSRAF